MTKLEIDVVKPNLHLRRLRNRSYHLMYSIASEKDVYKSSEIIDNIVKKHVDERGLAVEEADYKIMKGESVEEISESFVPLDIYLYALRKSSLRISKLDGIGSESGRMFGIDYSIKSNNYSDLDLLRVWIGYKELLEGNIDEKFDIIEKNDFFKIDRAKTIELMREKIDELDAVIPDLSTSHYVFEVASKKIGRNYIGVIELNVLKEDGIKKADKAVSELVDELKEFKGPCLSLDAKDFTVQRNRFYNASKWLVDNYGDILLNLDGWQERFFRFDP
jgi:hypothetical protein